MGEPLFGEHLARPTPPVLPAGAVLGIDAAVVVSDLEHADLTKPRALVPPGATRALPGLPGRARIPNEFSKGVVMVIPVDSAPPSVSASDPFCLTFTDDWALHSLWRDPLPSDAAPAEWNRLPLQAALLASLGHSAPRATSMGVVLHVVSESRNALSRVTLGSPWSTLGYCALMISAPLTGPLAWSTRTWARGSCWSRRSSRVVAVLTSAEARVALRSPQVC